MRAKKYSILLVIFFRIIKAIKMPKFASISQILSKFCHFFEFSSFFLPNVARLRCFIGFLKNYNQ